MAQQPVEMILVRQLAGYLSVPVLVMDPAGTVVDDNEPAERILGMRFEETGAHQRGGRRPVRRAERRPLGHAPRGRPAGGRRPPGAASRARAAVARCVAETG